VRDCIKTLIHTASELVCVRLCVRLCVCWRVCVHVCRIQGGRVEVAFIKETMRVFVIAQIGVQVRLLRLVCRCDCSDWCAGDCRK
jgi:hypothetical protein